MVGDGGKTPPAGVRLFDSVSPAVVVLVYLALAVISMETGRVQAVCHFKDVYIASEAWLELECECPKGTVIESDSTDFKIREKLKMIRVKPSGTKILFDSKTQKNTQSVEVKANEMTEHDPEKGRMRLFLRLKHVSASDEATYKCVISGRKDVNSGIKTKQLSYNFTLPPPHSTPPTPTTTWKIPASTPQPAQTTIAITTTQGPGPITGNPEESSKMNVYIAVAISSFLLIVIVIVIICFVRVRVLRGHIPVFVWKVRVRRQREKAARAESLDFDFGQTHTANHNLVFKPSTNGNANHCHGNHGADTCTHNACDNCHSPACNGAAQGQGHRQDNGGGRNARGVDFVPLLPVHTCPTHARTGRQSAGSEDDGEEHSRQRFLFDTPRRPRPRDNSHFAAPPARVVAPPPASRSCYALDSMDLVTDSEEPVYQYRNSRRLSFPRFHYGDEEDFTVLPSHYHGNAAYGHPRRSLSQQSLHRHSRRHRRPYPTQALPLDVTYAPSTNPRQPHNGFLPRDYAGAPYQTTPLVSPNGQRPRMRSEEGGEAPPFPTGSKERRQPSLAVRVREDNNVAYSDTFFGESSAREDAVHQAYEPVYNGGGGVVLPEPVPRVYRELQPPARSRRGATTSDAVMTSEDEMTRHRVSPNGTAAGNMIVDQQRHPQDRSGYPVQSLPSRRRRHNTSPPPRQYHTSSVPRKRSGDRHAGRSIHHNRSHPQLFYLSDAENGGLITYHLPGDSSHPQQYVVQHQPPQQRSGRSFSQSAADGFDYDSRHRGVSSNRRGSELESDGQGQSHPANQDRYSHSYSRAAERQNLLSGENVSPSRRPATTNLNVPLRGQVDVIVGSGSRGGEAGGRQTDPAVDRPSGRRGDRQRRRGRSNGEQDDPHATRRKATPATTSDTSPDLARQRSAHPRRHSVSSSDSDNFHTPTPNTPTTTTAPITIAPTIREPRPPHHREPHDEINLRDIKTDNETRPKRPVSSRINTAATNNNGDNLPVACAADVAVRDPGHGGPAPSRRAGGLQKKESVSRSRGGSRRSEASGGGPEGRGVGPEGWAHLGVDIMTSADNSLSGQCSQYTTTNHSTTVKTPHPRLE